MAERSTRRRTVGLVTTILGVTTLGLSLATAAGAVVGPEVSPTFVAGASNSNCDDLDTQANAGGQVWTEIDFAPAESGTTKSGVTVTYVSSTVIDFSSSVGVDAVYVKSGSNGSNLYVYAPTAQSPESFGDDGLTVPPGPPIQNISHVSVCIDVSNPTTTTTAAPTTTSTTLATTTSTTEAPTTTSTTEAPTTTSTTEAPTTTSTTEAPTTTSTTEAPTTTSTTEAPTTTSTTAEVSPTSLVGGIITTTTTADPGTTTTTAPRTEVSGVQIVRQPAQLARTGTDVRPFAYLGCLMIAVGVVLLGQYRRQTSFEF